MPMCNCIKPRRRKKKKNTYTLVLYIRESEISGKEN